MDAGPGHGHELAVEAGALPGNNVIRAQRGAYLTYQGVSLWFPQ
jgi:hypothetical protein